MQVSRTTSLSIKQAIGVIARQNHSTCRVPSTVCHIGCAVTRHGARKDFAKSCGDWTPVVLAHTKIGLILGRRCIQIHLALA